MPISWGRSLPGVGAEQPGGVWLEQSVVGDEVRDTTRGRDSVGASTDHCKNFDIYVDGFLRTNDRL